MKIEMLKEYGEKIFNQEKGYELGEKIFNNYKLNSKKTTLDFNGVDSINTAFWNALISKLLSEGKKVDPKDFFGIKNANETIMSTLAISLELYKYLEIENNE